ncbi:membrane-spanning 4-domains subfamily A member 4A-like [Crotalus tigris]|uniref:membrane-spanning 4-domains subfamily A member 4A-like n=1 Tax=Crotalus tigris TaxID=88082 RepID=UPI00192F8BC1|nr:membrane-spanning 4-domains subfamily A member 4A-like [Crotalus tigris]XP_039181739.1 membrane-spanning 4-domains subfamily A member 4A-like [Crotalus tigris]
MQQPLRILRSMTFELLVFVFVFVCLASASFQLRWVLVQQRILCLESSIQPRPLHITQIFIGIIGMIFGILLDIMNDYFIIYSVIKIAYWSGILYIISRSLAVAAARNPKIPLVQGALAMNVISAVSAGIGIIFLSSSITISFSYHFMFLCREFEHNYEEKCYESLHIIQGILAVLLIFTILEFCITISVASFGCKMLCRNALTETVVVIYENVTPASVEHPSIDCKQPEFP